MKKLLLLLVLVTSLVLPASLATQEAYAQNPLDPACKALQDSGSDKDRSVACSEDGKKNPIAGPDGVINKIAQGVALVAGSVAVIIIIVSGIRMVTSSGDSQSFKNARNGVIYAAVGLLIIVVAQALVTLVLNGVN